MQPVLEGLGLAGNHQGGRGIEQRHVAKGGLLAFENATQRIGVRLGVAAAQMLPA